MAPTPCGVTRPSEGTGTGTRYHADDLWNVRRQRSQIPKAACHKDASYGTCPEPAIQGDSKPISGGSRGRGRWRVTAERTGLLFGGDEKVLELGSGDVQRSEYIAN